MLNNGIIASKEYLTIKEYYGDKKTARSGVMLINHINEGLEVLQKINASEEARRAYCLHPIFQSDEDLLTNISRTSEFEPKIMVLVMEYRNIANAYLSRRKINNLEEIILSPLPEVNQMLVADKIQNYKDFMQYHFGTHERSNELFKYFQNWFDRLGISMAIFKALQENPTALHTHLLK